MQEIVKHLKNLLSLDLLKPLMGLKGLGFWDLMAEICLPSSLSVIGLVFDVVCLFCGFVFFSKVCSFLKPFA